MAHVAWHIHIGQEVHFDFDHTVALTGFAAAAAIRGIHVEAKAAWAITSLARSGHFGHEVANVREQTGVRGRVAARGATNGRLIHIDHFVEVVQPQNVFVGGRLVVRAVNAARCSGVQSFVHQGGFAGARNTRHTGEQADRKCSAHIFQVVTRGAHNFNEVFARCVALGRHFDGFATRQILTG